MGVGVSWEYGSRTRCPRGRRRVKPSAMHLDCEHDFQTLPRRHLRRRDSMRHAITPSLTVAGQGPPPADSPRHDAAVLCPRCPDR